MGSFWTNFSNDYLSSCWKNNSDRKDVVSFKDLRSGLKSHLEAYKNDKGLNISKEIIKGIVEYAFKKAHVETKADACKSTIELTAAKAQKIFKYYETVISSMQSTVESSQPLIENPIVKTPFKKAIERLSAISSTLFVRCVEPEYKREVKSLLSQVESHKIEQNKILDDATVFDFKNVLTLEIVARKLAYLNPVDGEVFKLFIDGKVRSYKVENIHLWGHQKAFGLVPVKKEKDSYPILAYSGTRFSIANPGVLETFIADFDPRGVGYLAYQLGKRNIKIWLNKNCSAKKQAYITGHSLGGALSRYTAVDYPHLTKEVFTFSAPGIAPAYKRKWRELKKRNTKRPTMINFNHSEDKLPTFGQSYMGKNYQVICNVSETVGKPLSKQRSIHNLMLFDKISVLCKTNLHKKVKLWKQIAIAVIPFIFAVTIAILVRFLFGTMTSHIAIFGPLRWAWHKFIADEENDHLFVPEHFQVT